MIFVNNPLFRSSIAKNLSILVTGTIIAQLITIGFQVVLRRIYLPADFGAFAVYMSIVGIAVTIASLRYEQSIILPKHHSDGYTLTKLSMLLAFILAFLFAAFLFIFSDYFISFVGFPESYKRWLVFLPITIFVFSIYQALNLWLIRINKFKVSGSNKPIRRLIEGVVQSLLGMFGKGYGLVIGDILAHSGVIARTLFVSRKHNVISEYETPKGLLDLAKRYREFPIKNALPSLLNAFSRLLPVIIISRTFNAETTGYFDLARVVLILPLSLITVSLNQLLVKQYSEKRNQFKSVKKETYMLFGILLLVSLVFVVLVKLFGQFGFTYIFGDAWKNSGYYAQILVWSFAIKFLISPFNASFIAFERLGLGSAWQAFYFFMVVGLFLIPYANIEQFLSFYVGVELIAFTTVGFINFSILHQYEKQIKASS